VGHEFGGGIGNDWERYWKCVEVVVEERLFGYCIALRGVWD
jgi:hypothetical protein